ncbi:MAG: threonine-phosphate decarboxylase CobD [Pseudomonadota bacterium]
MKLEHGGNVHAACIRFGGRPADWTDLSTGVNPSSWPVPVIPQSVWQQLPNADGVLESLAADYYGVTHQDLLAVPGSQWAIQQVPGLAAHGRVAIPCPGYAEHALAWRESGHTPVHYRDLKHLDTLVRARAVDHAVVINPNNPSGEYGAPGRLLELSVQLGERGGCLLVDEAFMDVRPADSLCQVGPSPALLILRSVGKFFGLAGLRLGFVVAAAPWLRRLEAHLPPWSVSGPARWIGERALADRAWQSAQRLALADRAADWQRYLRRTLPQLDAVGTELFVTLQGDPLRCQALYEGLAQRRLLARLFAPVNGVGRLRLGLPPAPVAGQVKRSLELMIEEHACDFV